MVAKSRFIRLGNNTFAIAMPMPIIAVPIKSIMDESINRVPIPSNIKISAANSVCSNPCLRANVAAIGDTIAKAISGNVVINPACEPLSPK